MSDNVLNPDLTISELRRLQYQSKIFQCQKCGITFEIYSDSVIESQKFCSECVTSNNKKEIKNADRD